MSSKTSKRKVKRKKKSKQKKGYGARTIVKTGLLLYKKNIDELKIMAKYYILNKMTLNNLKSLAREYNLKDSKKEDLQTLARTYKIDEKKIKDFNKSELINFIMKNGNNSYIKLTKEAIISYLIVDGEWEPEDFSIMRKEDLVMSIIKNGWEPTKEEEAEGERSQKILNSGMVGSKITRHEELFNKNNV